MTGNKLTLAHITKTENKQVKNTISMRYMARGPKLCEGSLVDTYKMTKSKYRRETILGSFSCTSCLSAA